MRSVFTGALLTGMAGPYASATMGDENTNWGKSTLRAVVNFRINNSPTAST